VPARQCEHDKRRMAHPRLVLPQFPDLDRAEDEMQDVENNDVVLIELGLVCAGRERQDQLKVGELVELDNES